MGFPREIEREAKTPNFRDLIKKKTRELIYFISFILVEQRVKLVCLFSVLNATRGRETPNIYSSFALSSGRTYREIAETLALIAKNF